MDNKSNELFWNAGLEDLKQGIAESSQEYRCIICEESFEKGRIYEIDSLLYDAKKAAELHIEKSHHSMLEYLLGMNSSFTGISEIQRKVLTMMAMGLSDKEIAANLGIAQSTIRNHRYKLREKERQAKLFLTVMELLQKNTNKKINSLDAEIIRDAHKTATTLDDRYNITDKESEGILKIYMDETGALKSYPVKEKRKLVVLKEIAGNFSKGKTYTENEVNRILKRIYEDYPTIKRALIEYGFLERKNDCSSYWVRE